MRGITLKQPWAHAVAHMDKRIENRVPTSPCANVSRVRGKIVAIHAGKSWAPGAPVRIIQRAMGAGCIRGAIIAVAVVEGVLGDGVAECSPYDLRWYEGDGAVGIVLRDVVPLGRPVPAIGRLGWWRLPADVEREVMRQIGGER